MKKLKSDLMVFSDVIKSVEGVHIGQIRQEIDAAHEKFKKEG